MGGAAFVDLDRTLLIVNSARSWFRKERDEGRLARRQAWEAAGWLGLYHLGLMNGPKALGRAVRSLQGAEEAVIAQRTAVFYEAEVQPHFAPGGLRAIERHRAEGTPVVLLTSATIYLARLVQAELALDDVLAMELGVLDGRFTGTIQRFCFGAGKVSEAAAWADARGISLAESAFYSDSITDLPMLEAVGHPRVVQPDARLARVAKRRGWPILDWSSGEPPADVGSTPPR